MKTGVIILIVIVLLVFFVGSAFVESSQRDGDQARGGELGVVAGGRGAATPR